MLRGTERGPARPVRLVNDVFGVRLGHHQLQNARTSHRRQYDHLGGQAGKARTPTTEREGDPEDSRMAETNQNKRCRYLRGALVTPEMLVRCLFAKMLVR